MNNLVHPVLSGLIIDFFYTGTNAMENIFLEVFENEVLHGCCHIRHHCHIIFFSILLKFPVLTVLLSFHSQYGHTEYPLHNHAHSISRCFSLLSYLSLHSRSTEVRLLYTLFTVILTHVVSCDSCLG